MSQNPTLPKAKCFVFIFHFSLFQLLTQNLYQQISSTHLINSQVTIISSPTYLVLIINKYLNKDMYIIFNDDIDITLSITTYTNRYKRLNT